MALEGSYTASGVVPINTIMFGPIDADASRGLSVQITSIGTSGSVQVQESMDGVTWTARLMQNVGGSVGVTSMTTAGMWWCNLVARYYRIVMTVATTAGTTAIRTRLSDDEFSEMGSSITVAALPAIPAGTSLIGSVQANMSATVGSGVNWSISRMLASLATTNATVVKASGGRIGQIRGTNAVAAGKYLKLYNKASSPTVGTDVPVLTFVLRGNSDFVIDVSNLGIFFSTGIAYAITGAIADSDTTAVAAADIIGMNILYV